MSKNKNKRAESDLKQISGFSMEKLATAVVLFTGILEETIDAIFIAQDDPGVLTPEYIDMLMSFQVIAGIVGEAAAVQVERSGLI